MCGVSKMKYKVLVKMTEVLELVVEAQSKEDAFQIADNTDGSEFDRVEGSGDWDIYDIIESEE